MTWLYGVILISYLSSSYPLLSGQTWPINMENTNLTNSPFLPSCPCQSTSTSFWPSFTHLRCVLLPCFCSLMDRPRMACEVWWSLLLSNMFTVPTACPALKFTLWSLPLLGWGQMSASGLRQQQESKCLGLLNSLYLYIILPARKYFVSMYCILHPFVVSLVIHILNFPCLCITPFLTPALILWNTYF